MNDIEIQKYSTNTRIQNSTHIPLNTKFTSKSHRPLILFLLVLTNVILIASIVLIIIYSTSNSTFFLFELTKLTIFINFISSTL